MDWIEVELEASEYARSCGLNEREDDLNRVHTFGYRLMTCSIIILDSEI